MGGDKCVNTQKSEQMMREKSEESNHNQVTKIHKTFREDFSTKGTYKRSYHLRSYAADINISLRLYVEFPESVNEYTVLVLGNILNIL